ncbi:hypothetical protein GJ496_008976 [Pomphorhynchus laevis]|nr:hypothetical protein GJ496_008976 [Pomphorhynchus laevis]
MLRSYHNRCTNQFQAMRSSKGINTYCNQRQGRYYVSSIFPVLIRVICDKKNNGKCKQTLPMSTSQWDDSSLDTFDDNMANEIDSSLHEQSISQHNVQTESLVKGFWNNVNRKMSNLTTDDFRCCDLPLARIKKIMKLDENVKMISAEAPIMLSKAADLFIQELTLRAWHHTINGKRRTLQRSDICTAAAQNEQFDFLIDILPREEGAVDDALLLDNSKESEEYDEDSSMSDTVQRDSVDSTIYQSWNQLQQPDQQPGGENADHDMQASVQPLKLDNMQSSNPAANTFYLVQVNDEGQIMLTNPANCGNIGVDGGDAQILQLSQEHIDQILSMQSTAADNTQYSPFLIVSPDNAVDAKSHQQHQPLNQNHFHGQNQNCHTHQIHSHIPEQKNLTNDDIQKFYQNNSTHP